MATMGLEPVMLGNLLGLVMDGGAARLAHEFASAMLIGTVPDAAQARWSFRTLPTLPRNARTLEKAGYALDMLCWPLRRPGIFRAGIRVGRAPSNDIPIASEGVSKLHAEIYVESAKVMIRDCASANGTVVGVLKLPSMRRHALKGGDVIWFGDSSLTFHSAESLAGLVLEGAPAAERR